MSTLTYDVTAVRRDFPIFDTGIAYLDSANTSQRPKQVTGAMLEYFEKFNSNIHRAAYRIAEEATVRYEATREKVRAFINAASTKEIIYTRGTTEAINLVAYSWGRRNIRSGDLIVLTILDHHSNIVPWQILAAEKDAKIEYVDIDERGELRQDQLAALLARGPKLVAFNLVSNALGTINPARDMVAAAKKAGATVLVDGAQSDVEGLTVYGPPPSRRAGVISFSLDGIHPHDLATIADRDQVCLRAGHHCAMPLMTRLGIPATARASFYVYTLKEEVDRLVSSIGEAQRIFA